MRYFSFYFHYFHDKPTTKHKSIPQLTGIMTVVTSCNHVYIIIFIVYYAFHTSRLFLVIKKESINMNNTIEEKRFDNSKWTRRQTACKTGSNTVQRPDPTGTSTHCCCKWLYNIILGTIIWYYSGDRIRKRVNEAHKRCKYHVIKPRVGVWGG